MLRRANFTAILGTLILIASSSSLLSTVDIKTSSNSSGVGENIKDLNVLPPPAQPGVWYNLSATITDVLAAERVKIGKEMENFDFASCEGCTAGTTPADLIPEKGGTPVRSILVSTWRSGTSFFGAILNAVPGSYYFFEPLCDFGEKILRTDEDQQLGIRKLKKLLTCNYTNMEDYLNFGQTITDLRIFNQNTRLWSVCEEFPQFCWQTTFLTPFCKLFPLQSMKTVRLRLGTAERLLEDESLNVHIMLLVRDPRGTMQSRKEHEWCTSKPDCGSVNVLCDDLVADFKSAKVLLEKYPTRFRTLRYEELSVNPYEKTQEILQFYGLPFDPSVKEFLDIHTKVNIGDTRTTYRNSKTTPFHWKQELSIEELKDIQEHCATAMELWGYRKIDNFTDYQRTFDPIIQPPPLNK